MNEKNEQPLTDDQLSALLRKWDVAAPARLEARIFAARPEPLPAAHRVSWWRFLLTGSIRVPVPVACCLVVLMVLALWRSAKPAVACPAPSVAAASTAGPVSSTCPAGSRC